MDFHKFVNQCYVPYSAKMSFVHNNRYKIEQKYLLTIWRPTSANYFFNIFDNNEYVLEIKNNLLLKLIGHLKFKL